MSKDNKPHTLGENIKDAIKETFGITPSDSGSDNDIAKHVDSDLKKMSNEKKSKKSQDGEKQPDNKVRAKDLKFQNTEKGE